MKHKYRQRVFTTTIKKENYKIMVAEWFSFTIGKGVGQGGSDVSQLQDCDSVACRGGGASSWPGLEQGLGRMGGVH